MLGLQEMAYESRIKADPDYLQALGRAFYNFQCLELMAIWTIMKLSSDGYKSVPSGKGATAGKIARALHTALKNTAPPLEKSLRDRLEKFSDEFDAAIDLRNKLIHAKPYTAPDRAQQLFYDGGPAWPIEDVYAAAKRFEAVALWAAENFWEDLVKARP
ncbi:MAG: hypothetical protein M3441_22735 [Chloroflexota bacterium]|nr:hypothetical protein [Chloroflexota bacterium]